MEKMAGRRRYFFFSAAFCAAQRFFCASEIAFRASADIVRLLRPDPAGRPGPRFGLPGPRPLPAGRPRRAARCASWPRSVRSLEAVSRISAKCFAMACRCPSQPSAFALAEPSIRPRSSAKSSIRCSVAVFSCLVIGPPLETLDCDRRNIRLCVAQFKKAMKKRTRCRYHTRRSCL
jgi:hypothetical protein